MKRSNWIFCVICLLLAVGCAQSRSEKKMNRFADAFEGVWEISEITYQDLDSTIVYADPRPQLIFYACDFDQSVSAYCEGQILDQEKNSRRLEYVGLFSDQDQMIGEVAFNNPDILDRSPTAFNDSLSLDKEFSVRFVGDTLFLEGGSITVYAGDISSQISLTALKQE